MAIRESKESYMDIYPIKTAFLRMGKYNSQKTLTGYCPYQLEEIRLKNKMENTCHAKIQRSEYLA